MACGSVAGRGNRLHSTQTTGMWMIGTIFYWYANQMDWWPISILLEWYIFQWSTAKQYDQPPYSSDQMTRNLSMKIGDVD